MPLAPSPMESFQIGQQIGTAGSRVSGLGQVITNIVADAKAKGLLQAQSQFQTAGSQQLALGKEARSEAALLKPKTTIFAGPGGERETVTATRGTDVKSLSAPDPLAGLLAGIIGEEETPTPSAGEGDMVTIQFNDGTTSSMTRAAAKDAGYLQ